MTVRALYNDARRALSAVTEDAAFEASCLAEYAFGLTRTALLTHGDRVAADEDAARLQAAVCERLSGRPLQYILGAWAFMGLSLLCGEGVLIPREDTAVLVETVLPHAGKNSRGLDLCAGTGAVALKLAEAAGAAVTAVEKFDAAFSFLQRNIARYPALSVTALQGDVLDAAFANAQAYGLDFIASNPPYIEAQELPRLQREVQREPHTALCGGADGLLFYRALCTLWAGHLRPGGMLAVEIGETQGAAVHSLFEAAGFRDIRIDSDSGGLPRAVSGIYK